MLSKKIYRIIIVPFRCISSAQRNNKAPDSGLSRVGNEIELSDRDYFRLFPAITDFDHAVVTRDSSGGSRSH